MIEQQARVLSVDGPSALVLVGRQSGCAVCDAGKGCGAGLFGRLVRRKPLEIRLDNAAGARVGQSVQLGLQESLYMRLVIQLYGLPLVAGLGGGFIGRYLGMRAAAAPVVLDALVLVGALGGALVALIFLHRASKRDINSKDIAMLKIVASEGACEGTGIQQHAKHEV